MKYCYKLLLCALALFLVQGHSAAMSGELARYQASHSDIRVLLERDSLAIGETNWLAFEITPRDGWHTYWLNPGDSGAAPILNFSAPEGIMVGTPKFGSPMAIPVAHLMNYGMVGSSTILIPLKVSAELKEGRVQLELNAEWLVCEQECVPQLATLELKLKAALDAATSLETRSVFVGARASTPELAFWDSELKVASVSSELRLLLEPSEVEGLSSAYFFPESDGIVDYAADQVWVLDDEGLLLRLPKSRGSTEPKTGYGVLQLGFEDGHAQNYALEPTLEITQQSNLAPKPIQVEALPIWQAAIYAFIGGIILNLMPCVFPILSLKAFAFVAANYKTATNRRKEGWAYTFGIWLSFMVIVAVLMALRAGGAAVGWGFQLQEPLFVGLLALLMVMVALSLAGLFTIQIGIEGAGQNLAGREGAQGAFFKGILATLVATPCTAPLMAPAIGFALTQPAFTVVMVFSLLAFGLALPFLALSYSARVAAAMPKPGPWMEKVKQGLAFPMLLTAAWLIYVYDLQAGAWATLVLLICAVLVAFAIWLWGQSQHKVLRSVAVIVLLVSIVGLAKYSVTAQAPQSRVSGEEMAFSEDALKGLLDEGKPVFVYFTAEWCITCKVNEKIALNREETQAAFEEKGITVLKGDWTNRNDEIAMVLARYGRAGVPLYLYFPVGQKDPIVLPEIITASSIVDIL